MVPWSRITSQLAEPEGNERLSPNKKRCTATKNDRQGCPLALICRTHTQGKKGTEIEEKILPYRTGKCRMMCREEMMKFMLCQQGIEHDRHTVVNRLLLAFLQL